MPNIWRPPPLWLDPRRTVSNYAPQTIFYLPSSGAAPISPAFDAGWEETANADRLKMVTTSIASAMTDKSITTILSSGQTLFRQYVSAALQAQTFNSRVVIYARAFETLGSLNGFSQVVLKVVSSDGSVVRGTLFAIGDWSNGAEWATALTNKSFVNGRMPTAVTAQAGDYLVLEIGLSHDALITTATINFGDNAASNLPEDETTTAASNPFFGIAQVVLFQQAQQLSVDGVLTTAGEIIRQANKALVGTLTSSGSLVRLATKTVGLSGTLTTAGALVRQVNKLLAGTLTTSGTLTTNVIRALSVSGTLTTAGNLIRQVNKLLAGTLTTSGTLVRQANKLIAGTLSSTGTLVRKVNTSYSGQLTSSGDIDTQVQTHLSGTLTTSGTIVRLVSKLLSGTLSSGGSLVKLVNKLLSGTLSSSGTLSRQVATSFTGVLGSSGQVVTGAVTRLAGTLTSSGTVSYLVNKLLGGVLGSSGNLVKKVNTSFAGVLSNSGQVVANAATTLSGTLSTSGAISYIVNKLLDGTLSSSGVISYLVSKLLDGALTNSGNVTRRVNTAFTGVLDASGNVVQGVVTSLAGTLSSAGSIAYNVSKLIEGVLGNSGNIGKQANKRFSGELTTQGDLTSVFIPGGGVVTPISMGGTLTTSGQLSLLVIPGAPPTPVPTVISHGGRVRYRIIPKIKLPFFRRPERVKEPVRRVIRANSRIDLSVVSSLSINVRQRGVINSLASGLDPVSTLSSTVRQVVPITVSRISDTSNSTFEYRTRDVFGPQLEMIEKQREAIGVLQKELAASRQNETLALLGVL